MDYYEVKTSEYEGWMIPCEDLKCPVCSVFEVEDPVLFKPYPLVDENNPNILICQECHLHFTEQQLKDLTKDYSFPCMSILEECRKLLSGGKLINRRKNGLLILRGKS